MRPIIKPIAASVLAIFALGGFANAQAEEKKLYIFNWSQYMDPEIIKTFEEEHDVKVVENYYNSLPEMFSKLQAGGKSQYDVVVASNYFVRRLIETGMVQKLDHSKILNLDNLDPRFMDPSFDPENQYTAAYQWVTTGLIYNKEELGEVDSWSVMFDPERNPDNPFSLISDGQVSMAIACAYLGYDYRCTDTEKWREAAMLIIDTKNRSNFNGFADGTPQLQQIVQGNIDAGMTYNGDYLYFKSEDPEAYENIEFTIPKEGAEIGVDSMMIPSEAPSPDLAHKFINFVLDAEIGAQLSNWTRYSTPNKAAEPMLDKALREPPATPTDEEMKRLHFTPSLKGQKLKVFSQLWTDVMSR